MKTINQPLLSTRLSGIAANACTHLNAKADSYRAAASLGVLLETGRAECSTSLLMLDSRKGNESMLSCLRMLLGIAALAASGSTFATDPYPVKIPAPGGEVILNDASAVETHKVGVAFVRRSGDRLYLGGQIVYRADGENNDAAALKRQSRRTFQHFKSMLNAAGASFQDVVMINSFHVWDGPNFKGSRIEQFNAFAEVLREFMNPPYAAWTAVGTSGLLDPRGILEVQLIARVPDHDTVTMNPQRREQP